MKDFMKINENDNVIVALKEMKKGEKISLENTEIEALETIPAGHKMAVKDICEGADVIKYGFRIGTAKEDIKAGQWVHTHNIKTALGDLLEYKYEPVHMEEKITEGATFLGFQRPDGKAGVRNEIWIIPTVGCVNNIATALAKRANAKVKGSVQEVIAFPHPYGCSQMGDDQEHTRTILADLINHPNAGGVLVLGLGCENSNIDVLKPYIDAGTLNVVSGQTDFDSVATPAWDTQTALERMQNILASYYADGTQLDVALCSNDSTALGVTQAIESDYAGDNTVLITGQDGDEANLANIVDGKQSMTVYKAVANEAVVTLDLAKAMLAGDTVDESLIEKSGWDFECAYDTESYETSEGNKCPSFLLVPTVVTKDNLQEALVDPGYYTMDDDGYLHPAN